jgi:hypothetical protein
MTLLIHKERKASNTAEEITAEATGRNWKTCAWNRWKQLHEESMELYLQDEGWWKYGLEAGTGIRGPWKQEEENVKKKTPEEIWNCFSGDYENHCLVGCDEV